MEGTAAVAASGFFAGVLALKCVAVERARDREEQEI